MPMTVASTGPINNRTVPNRTQRSRAQDVIASLQYADLWRNAGTLHDNRVVRVDMQGIINGPPRQSNIQVQLDGVQGNSTIAHANVSWSIMTDDPANQLGALRKVISALNQSLDTGNSYSVTGTNP
jgi:hypothetical protein